MKTTITLAGALILCGVVARPAAGKDTKDKVMKDMLALMKKATQALTAIKDEKTAKAAHPKLDKIGKQRKAIKERFNKLGLSKKEGADVIKKYAKEGEIQEAKLKKEVARVSKIPGGKAALNILFQQTNE
jgi:hypothetical protein